MIEISKLLSDHPTKRRALIATALPIEIKSVLAHLTYLETAKGRTGTIYEFGILSGTEHDWLVAVIENGPGQPQTQTKVQDACTDIDKLEIALFAGIAGSRKEDVPIGSVVVANRVYNPYTGKHSKGGFSSRPQPISIDSSLEQLARKLCREGAWPLRIKNPQGLTLLESTDSRYPQPYPPQAAVGPIAGVEAVLSFRDNPVEKAIALHCDDAQAVEMEGYGFLTATQSQKVPALVVRGISDMSQSKAHSTDAHRQPIAAAHAAAFAVEFLLTWDQYNPKYEALQVPRSGSVQQDETTTPPNSDESELQKKPENTDKHISQDESVLRMQFVLTYEGSPDDFPSERVQELVTLLRNKHDDASIELVKTAEGSFHLFLEAARSTFEKIRAFPVLTQELSDAVLTGVTTIEEYEELQIAKNALNSCSQELLNWPKELPGGVWLDRPELNLALNKVRDLEHSTTVILGAPGAGKSALLSALGLKLKEAGRPVLAIKADLLPQSVETEADLQRALALDFLPSELIVRIAKAQPVVLLIDQLDALAGYLDLSVGRLSVLLNLVRKVGHNKNVHVVLSARKFEYEHDVRLRSVAAESLELALPTTAEVAKALQENSINSNGWSQAALEFLRTPQYLNVFLRLSDRDAREPSTGYRAMLDRLWDSLFTGHNHTAGTLASLIMRVAHQMAEEESLWISPTFFDDDPAQLDKLLRAGILSRSGSRIGFSHQTLFDHALARSFAKGQHDLGMYALERQSSLFVRPKLWASLEYLREVNQKNYEFNLSSIWSAPDLRRHIRLLLIDFLGHQASPSLLEVEMIESALKRTDIEASYIYRACSENIDWFEHLNHTFIAQSMQKSPEAAFEVMPILTFAAGVRPEKVAELIDAHWIALPQYDELVWRILQNAQKWPASFMRFAKLMIERSQVSSGFLDHIVSIVGVEQPEYALTIVRSKLEKDLNAARPRVQQLLQDRNKQRAENVARNIDTFLGYANPYEPLTALTDRRDDWYSLDALAEASPAKFLSILWPWFLTLTDEFIQLDEEEAYEFRYKADLYLDWHFDTEDDREYSRSNLLSAFSSAVAELAQTDRDAFLKWKMANENSQALPVQRLIAHGFASAPEDLANEALDFLLKDYRRLTLGGFTSAASQTTKRLIEAAAPYWSAEQVEQLARWVKSLRMRPPQHLTEATKRRSFLRRIRSIRLGILRSLPEEKLSGETKEHVRSESRAVPEPMAPLTSRAGWIGSEMTAQEMLHAKDADVINIFKEIPDASEWDHPKHFLKGGSIQLSREFSEFAKQAPTRAVRIAKQLDELHGQRAIGYALNTLAEEHDPALVFDLIHIGMSKAFAHIDYKQSVAFAIERLIRRNVEVPIEHVELLKDWLATSDYSASPSTDEDADVNAIKRPEGSILWDHAGYSALPGGYYPIFETLARCYLARKWDTRLSRLLIDQLALEQRAKFWRSILHTIYYWSPTEFDLKQSFVTKLASEIPSALKSPDGVKFLAHMQNRAPTFVLNLISDWDIEENEFAAQAAGELIALMHTVHPGNSDLAKAFDTAFNNPRTESARIGMAFSAVHLSKEPRFRRSAHQQLLSLTAQATEAVWSAISYWFVVIDEIVPEPEAIDLLRALSMHVERIDAHHANAVVEKLQTLLPHEASLVGKFASNLVAIWRKDLGNFSSALPMAAPPLIDLALTLHRLSPLTREIGISLFEDLLNCSAHTAADALREIDMRMYSSRSPLISLRRRKKAPARRKGIR